MSRRSGASFDSQGASVSGCRLALALTAVSIEAVGCQNARSGLSPVATFVWTPCSYGSGMVTTWTLAPVACWKPSMTFLGTVLLFCAAQIVSFTPSSFAVGSAQVTAVSLVESAAGSLHAVTPSDEGRRDGQGGPSAHRDDPSAGWVVTIRKSRADTAPPGRRRDRQ